MPTVPILTTKAFGLTVGRLCYQLIEDHGDLEGVALVGLQPRGILLARRLRKELQRIMGKEVLQYGELDITFHRDDFRHRATTAAPSITQLDFKVTRTFRYGRISVIPTFEVFNINNSDAIISYVTTNALSTSYLAPNSIMQGRLYGVGAMVRW